MKVALTYRVLQHWRVPVFRRLASWPGIEFCAFHGGDFQGTKVVNSKSIFGFAHHQLATLRFRPKRGGERMCLPLCPALPIRLWQMRPDVILAEGGSNLLNNFLVLAYALATRTPFIWWTLGELAGEQHLSLGQRAFRWLTMIVQRRATLYLGYSSVAVDYFKRMGYAEDRQFRAVNCVDTDQVFERIQRARAQVEPLRRRLGLDGRKVILYIGAIAPSKRLEDLIIAYARLRGKHTDARLLIVGEGAHRPVLERYAREQGAEDVIFTGEVIEGVSAYFLLGDVFVLPGLGGLAISEAMAHGLPMIVTQADGCEVDLIEDGANGRILKSGDVSGLTSCLDAFLSDTARLRQMGAHSRWIIEHRYNIHTYMENVVAALRRACELRPRRPTCSE